MKASLDTNVVIHFYRAGCQHVLFEFFDEGVFLYEQLRDVELEHHGQDVLSAVDVDIAAGKIIVYTEESLRSQAVWRLFEQNVRENRLLYGAGDLGEVYAISLAQTIGAMALVTDDVKQGGPYMSLLQLQYDQMPFNFADVLILCYLLNVSDAEQTVKCFNTINQASGMGWSFRSSVNKFIKRFLKDPYRVDEQEWMNRLVEDNHIKVKSKFMRLLELL